MGFYSRDVLNLDLFINKIQVVAGKRGLNSKVRWVHVAEVLDDVRDITEWIYGGELFFITGLGVKENEDKFVDFVLKLQEKGAAGLIVFVGKYINKIPEKVKKTADRIDFPLFELLWEVPLVDSTKEICRAVISREVEQRGIKELMNDLLFQDVDLQKASKKLTALGYELKPKFAIGLINIDNFSDFLEANSKNNEKFRDDIYNCFYILVEQIIKNYFGRTIIFDYQESIIFVVPELIKNKAKMCTFVEDVNNKLEKKLMSLTVSVGVGRQITHLKHLNKSYKEAQDALSFTRKTGKKGYIAYYNDIGVYSLLFKLEKEDELRFFYLEMLEELINYDKIYQTSLVKTLEKYLNENKSIQRTSEKLYIHRNTLKYRLEKIEAITGKSLANNWDCFNLQMAFYIKKII